jgi:hypothetical protein
MDVGIPSHAGKRIHFDTTTATVSPTVSPTVSRFAGTSRPAVWKVRQRVESGQIDRKYGFQASI